MDRNSYQQYDAESANWLRRGRLSLLSMLLQDALEPGVEHRLLEVGAGVGQNVPALAEHGHGDVAEIDQLGLERLGELDMIARVYTEPIPFVLDGRYDVICALDVIEHLKDDRGAISWIADGLEPGGCFIASVPAYQWLFGDHDVALGHYRRYTGPSFLSLMPEDLEVTRAGYFNSSVLPPVAMARQFGRLRRRMSKWSGEPQKQSSLLPGPIDRFLERVLEFEAKRFMKRRPAPFGLSIFVVARKTSPQV